MFQRTLEKTIKEVSKNFPVILLTGPRQVGKTTLFKLCAKNNTNYVTLDNMEARNLAQNDPALFVKTYKTPLIIDEVQYAPQLLSYIKIDVDNNQKNGQYWLTGSQKFHLMKGITESLAGRVAIIDLLGLSQTEISNKKSIPFLPNEKWINFANKNNNKSPKIEQIYKQIWLGSFPKVNLSRKSSIRDIFYSSYIQTYIQRDVKDILQISDERNFYNFLVAIAARTGQLLNYSDLSRDIGVDNKTIKSWISILQTSGLIYLLNPYYNNISKRLIKTPKIYFLDTGLCCYLTKWSDSQTLQHGAMSGSILETYIFGEILKSYWHNATTPNFYYYRDDDQKEIDLIIETAENLHPIEFKKSATPSMSNIRNFNVLNKFSKQIGHGSLVCFVDSITPLNKNISAIPVGFL